MGTCTLSVRASCHRASSSRGTRHPSLRRSGRRVGANAAVAAPVTSMIAEHHVAGGVHLPGSDARRGRQRLQRWRFGSSGAAPATGSSDDEHSLTYGIGRPRQARVRARMSCRHRWAWQ
jgi:hypothetical protein